MITLSIKGNVAAAWRAADKHGIELTSIVLSRRDGTACTATTFKECEAAVRDWFHENAELVMGFGYPDGTLLHFSLHSGE